jgi:hypothetical protein
VRAYGGVLEHPAWSTAWAEFGLPVPDRRGGWQRGICGGGSAAVEQWRYGHPAKKATWLYAFGVPELPALRWGHTPDVGTEATATVSWCGNRVKAFEARVGDLDTNGRDQQAWANRRRLSPEEASSTPQEFRDELLGIVRKVERQSKGQLIVTPPAFRDELLSIARGAR